MSAKEQALRSNVADNLMGLFLKAKICEKKADRII